MHGQKAHTFCFLNALLHQKRRHFPFFDQLFSNCEKKLPPFGAMIKRASRDVIMAILRFIYVYPSIFLVFALPGFQTKKKEHRRAKNEAKFRASEWSQKKEGVLRMHTPLKNY